MADIEFETNVPFTPKFKHTNSLTNLMEQNSCENKIDIYENILHTSDFVDLSNFSFIDNKIINPISDFTMYNEEYELCRSRETIDIQIDENMENRIKAAGDEIDKALNKIIDKDANNQNINFTDEEGDSMRSRNSDIGDVAEEESELVSDPEISFSKTQTEDEVQEKIYYSDPEISFTEESIRSQRSVSRRVSSIYSDPEISFSDEEEEEKEKEDADKISSTPPKVVLDSRSPIKGHTRSRSIDSKSQVRVFRADRYKKSLSREYFPEEIEKRLKSFGGFRRRISREEEGFAPVKIVRGESREIDRPQREEQKMEKKKKPFSLLMAR